MDVKEFFGKNAEKYAKSTSHAKGKDLDILVNLLQLQTGYKAIDLAAGTGFTSVALATRIESVVAYDMTSEMLDEARKFASSEGVNNIEFRNGDVQDLPFGDETFDIATCRRAAHHFQDKKAFLSEVKRTLKKGGRFGLSDMAAPEDDIHNLFNGMEKFRDSSHVGAESVSSWESLVKESGLNIVKIERMDERIEFSKWLYPVALDSEEGKGCRQFLENNKEEFSKVAGYEEKTDSFIKRRIVLVAEKPGH